MLKPIGHLEETSLSIKPPNLLRESLATAFGSCPWTLREVPMATGGRTR